LLLNWGWDELLLLLLCLLHHLRFKLLLLFFWDLLLLLSDEFGLRLQELLLLLLLRWGFLAELGNRSRSCGGRRRGRELGREGGQLLRSELGSASC